MSFMNREPLGVRAMTRDDWAWIADWFHDEVLERELGPLDEDWLEYVLADESGVQLVVTMGEHPAALVGCTWDQSEREHGITDLAVDPTRRGTGLGRLAIEVVLAWPGHPPAERWIAFVDQDNPPAHRFFTAIAWSYEGVDDGMHRFSLEGTAPARR